MEKVLEKSFFKRDPETVARELVGKVLVYKRSDGVIQRYVVLETEAYDANEEFCYGHGKTKETAKGLKVIHLFSDPGTACVYGGLLLISVQDENTPANVLIRACKKIDNDEIFESPDYLAKELKFYKTCKGKKVEGYIDVSGTNDIITFEDAGKVEYDEKKRVNIKDPKEWNFKIK